MNPQNISAPRAQNRCQRNRRWKAVARIIRAEVQQEWSEFRSFARCMRRHGVPNWPDAQPRSGTDPRPMFDIQPVDPQSPINPDSPQIKSKLPDCDSLLKTANPNRL